MYTVSVHIIQTTSAVDTKVCWVMVNSGGERIASTDVHLPNNVPVLSKRSRIS